MSPSTTNVDVAAPLERFEIAIGAARIPVLVGEGAVLALPGLLEGRWRRLVVVVDRSISLPIGLEGTLSIVVVRGGEGCKQPSVLAALHEELVSLRLGRGDGLVAIGGGSVTDLVGFAAATYLRGIECALVPTTLLAMVDAAIGGKTAVNLLGGKNLQGAFWQPVAIACDLGFLRTLPEREWRSGLGELAKYSFLGAPTLAHAPLLDQVRRSIELKVSYVADDERESGQRALLNYGHTLGHAIEGAYLSRGRDGAVSHGEAVAIGIAFAAHVAARLGRIGSSRVVEHHEVLSSYELPSRVPDELSTEELMRFLLADKKHRRGLAMVLDGPSGLELVEGLEEHFLAQMIEEFRRG
jgi:5-deoxy-5-amino-3-dehydroquinate synthase